MFEETDTLASVLHINAAVLSEGFHNHMVRTAGARLNEYAVAFAVKAVLGAIYEDSGQDMEAVTHAVCALGLLPNKTANGMYVKREDRA